MPHAILFIQADQISISPSRQRQEFDQEKQTELAQSIADRGLLQPLGVRRAGILVWGERRLRALQDLWFVETPIRFGGELLEAGLVPVIDLGDVDELEAEEAEYAENTHRADLTWQESATATARLEDLRARQAIRDGKPAPTVASLALETKGSTEGIHHENTRRELIVAKHLADPEVAAAKSTDEAFKILRRKEEDKRRVQLAADVGRTYSAATAHTCINGDSLAFMSEQPAGQYDVICTDPPYGISADEFGDSGGHAAGAHFYKDDYETWLRIITTLAKEGFRITKPAAHLYCFCDITRFEEAKAIFGAAGWKCFRTPIIWHKPNGNRLPWVDSGPQRKYELILYAKKGDKKVTRIYPDVVSYPADANLGHPAQKPVALIEDLLKRSVNAGDTVLDPFAGSGPILGATNTLKCRATAIEADPAAYGICLGRLDELSKQKEIAL